MFRFYYLVIVFFPLIIYYITKAEYYCAHEDKYDDHMRFNLAIRIIHSVQKHGRISTVSYGNDKLPEEGGYIMYANHQGKYDALGIMDAHKTICSVIMDAQRSKMPLADQVIELVRGIRLDRTNFRQQIKVLDQMSKDTSEGRRFIYFPEGGYDHNGNKLQEFRAGAFKVAMRVNAPIVPVAIYDSHIPFDFSSLRKVTTQVYFMDPIYPEQYEGMSTQEVSAMVKDLIENKLDELEENRRLNGFNSKFKQYRVVE